MVRKIALQTSQLLDTGRRGKVVGTAGASPADEETVQLPARGPIDKEIASHGNVRGIPNPGKP